MQFEDIKLNKIYQVVNIHNISVGILIPLHIEDGYLYTYTIQTVGDSNWLYTDDRWSQKADDFDCIHELKNGIKTESGIKVNKRYIVNRIFTSRLGSD